MISMIAAMTKDRLIGAANDLPWHLPADLANFKRLTTNHPCIMGANTFESIYARLGKPLPNRTNIVLSRTMQEREGVHVCRSVQEALNLGNSLDEEVFVIGGASIYTQFLPYADKLYISWVDGSYDGDTYFPSFSDFEKVFEEKREGFTYTEYRRC